MFQRRTAVSSWVSRVGRYDRKYMAAEQLCRRRWSTRARPGGVSLLAIDGAAFLTGQTIMVMKGSRGSI
jgi:hypothetical protein